MSGEFKFTPGPWHVSNENALVIRDDEWLIPVATAGYVTNDEELATAHLIASAPRLLEVAISLLEALESENPKAYSDIIDDARAEIAKALGESK